MRTGWGICASLSVALASCTAPLIDEGVKKFHSGSTQANSILVSNANDVVAVTRFGLVMDNMNASGPMVGPIDVPSGQRTREFAQYVCAQSIKFALLRAHQGALARLDLSDDGKKTLPSKQKIEEKVRNNYRECNDEVIAYVKLGQEELPDVGSLAPKRMGAGLTESGALAGLALIGSVVKLLTSIYDGVEAEYKAGEIKRLVQKDSTQETVITALNELSKPDQDLIDFCKDGSRQAICATFLPKADPGDKEKYWVIELPRQNVPEQGKYLNVCEATKRYDQVKPLRSQLTIMDNATLYRRWMAIRIAYYRYLDVLRYQQFASTLGPGKAAMPAFEARRKALELAVAQFTGIQPAADVVAEQKYAWAELTAMSCGKLTITQHVAALSAFANRMNVLSGDGKGVSDAWTGYRDIVYPKQEDENDGDK